MMSWKEARVILAPPKFDPLPVDDLLLYAREGSLQHVWSPAVERVVRSLFETDARGRARARLARANHMRILRAMYAQKPRELLARIACPTLMICARPRAHAMADEAGFYEMKKASVGKIRALKNPNVSIEWITSVHDIPLDRPADLATRIAGFAKKARDA